MCPASSHNATVLNPQLHASITADHEGIGVAAVAQDWRAQGRRRRALAATTTTAVLSQQSLTGHAATAAVATPHCPPPAPPLRERGSKE